MAIGTETKRHVLDWLKQKGVRSECLACGKDQWEVGDIVALPVTPQGGGTALGGPSFPLVQIYCENCGFVMHFNSTQIGLTM